MATRNKMLETQTSQVAQQQVATAAPTGIFPGQLQPNPKGHANVITLQNGTELDGQRIQKFKIRPCLNEMKKKPKR